MRFLKLRTPLLVPLILVACSDAPTLCDSAFPQLKEQGEVSDWRVVADSLLAVAPPDRVLHIVVFLSYQAKQAFVEWAISTGGGFGYGFTTGSGEAPKPDPGERRSETGAGGIPPLTVPGVMIRYEYRSFSGYSIYIPVWALEGLKEQNITGVDFGLTPGDLPQC
jgi:hypothetical protein